MADSSRDLESIRGALLETAEVRDCAVLRRKLTDGGDAIIAYLACELRLDTDALKLELSRKAPQVPDSFVVLSALPLTEQGDVDFAQLETIPVLDHDFVARCESALRDVAGTGCIAAVVEANPIQIERLHLQDLIYREPVQPKAAASHKPNEVNGATDAKDLKAAFSTGAVFNRDGLPKNLAEALARVAQIEDSLVITLGTDGAENRQSYAQLLAAAEGVLASLRGRDLKPNDRVILQCTELHETLAAFWACMLGGFVAAPLAPVPSFTRENAATEKLKNVWRLLEPQLVITSAGSARETRAWASQHKLDGRRVESFHALSSGRRDSAWHDCTPDDPALILFTSGSTGLPKGVVQTHGNLVARSASNAQMHGFSSADCTLNWFPLDHVGGIVMFHLADLYVGATQVHVPGETIGRDPLLWLELLHRYRANRTWAPNFAYGLIADREEEIRNRFWDLSRVDFILNGGEAIVPRTARRFMDILAPFGLAETAMRPAWGMSETCSGVTFASGIHPDDDEVQFAEVGLPIPGFSLRIIGADGRIANEGQTGRLQVRGLCVTPGYYKNPEENAVAFTQDGWFETGDLAVLRNGSVTITGRSKDVIIVNGVNFHSHEIEAIVEDVPGVDTSYTAACAVRPHGVQTDQLCIFFHPLANGQDELANLARRIRETVLRKIGAVTDFLVPIECEDIPKSAIGKILRSELKSRFEQGEFAGHVKQLEIAAGVDTIPAWFYQKIWIPSRPRLAAVSTNTSYVILADAYGLADALCRRLQLARRQCIVARPGPLTKESCTAFLKSIQSEISGSITIVHCATYAPNAPEPTSVAELRAAVKESFYSVLYLSQALLAGDLAERHPRLFVASNRFGHVEPNQPVRAELTVLPGFLRSLALEAEIETRLVDLDGESVERDAQALVQELDVMKTSGEVAWRAGERRVPTLKKVTFDQEPRPLPLVKQGFYIVTGGLGGVGSLVCKCLAERCQARLLILGRAQLPVDSLKAGRLREIEESGADVLYRALDLADSEALYCAVASARAHWNCEPDGVLHLAGVGNLLEHWHNIENHWISTEKPEAFEWMFGSKLYGTWNLLELFKNRPEAMFVAFSSVNGTLGGATFSAYSAANSALDALTLDRLRRSHQNTYLLQWSMWDSIGLTGNAPEFAREASRKMGYHILSPQAALGSMEACLSHVPGATLIGINGADAHIQKHIEGQSHQLERLQLFHNVRGRTRLSVTDRFGTAFTIGVTYLEEMPRLPGGAIDKAYLRRIAAGKTTAGTSERELTTETERAVATLWRQLLRVTTAYPDDRFFEAGGDSLLAMRLLNRIEQTTGIRLPLRTLFDDPTVRGLANALDAAVATPDLKTSSFDVDELSDEEVDALLQKMTVGKG